MAEARKAMRMNNWDWSAYALYASGTYPLEELRLK
jgi:hypothetical protein